jgi:hypothetical protein
MNRKGDAEIKRVLDRLRVLVDEPKKVLELIDIVEALLLAKGDDYSGNKDVFGNFRFISSASANPEFKVFITLISVKVGRLFNLFNSPLSYSPRFESMWDTVKDLLGYIVLWLAYHLMEEQDAIHSDSAD